MNKPRFLELVRNPDQLEFFDLEKLEEVVATFPYFQAAHLLIAKIAKEQSSMFAAEKLNRAGVCTLDRKNLKKWMQIKPRKLTVFINHEPEAKELGVLPDKALEISNQNSPVEIELPQISNGEKTVIEREVSNPIVVEAFIQQTTEVVEDDSQKENTEIIEEVEVDLDERKEEFTHQEETVPLEYQPVSFITIEETVLEKEKPEIDIASKPSDQDTSIEASEVGINDVNDRTSEKSNSKAVADDIAAPLDFYAELQQNLEKLKLNKLSARHLHLPDDMEGLEIGDDKKAVSEESVKEAIENTAPELTIAPDAITESNHEINASPIDESDHPTWPTQNIDESRLEEILRNDISEQNHISQKDLLIEYFNYLAQRRVARMNDKKSINIILDKFIAEEPSIPKLKPEAPKTPLVDLAEKSTRATIKIVSENFAKILVLQGKVEKAIEMYEELSLKNPEKKAYFADLILKLKEPK